MECKHKNRVFFYEEKIDLDRPKEKKRLGTLKGTRKVHSILSYKPGDKPTNQAVRKKQRRQLKLQQGSYTDRLLKADKRILVTCCFSIR